MIVIMSAKTAIPAPGGSPRTVAVLVFDGLSMFEFAVACEVFGYGTPHELGVDWYEFLICGPDQPSVTTDSHGLRLAVPHRLADLPRADTVVVPACHELGGAPVEVLTAIQAAHARGARIVSLCTGAFVLAAAGLLDGRRVTTHWDEAPDLAAEFPLVTVDPDVLYIDDGDILTSAGSAASIDLCLHIVRQDYGAQVATRLARQLVVPPYREGGQAQYIETPLPELAESDLFADTVAWMQEHLDEAVTITDLAARSAMSRRTFARRFLASTATTPYQWLLRQRLQQAQRLLETSELPVDGIARRCGLSDAANLRKHFGRHLHTTPQAYRTAFRTRTGADQKTFLDSVDSTLAHS
jgi:AraC family transcriptional regulator, transcriptional activator FtrA